MSKDRVVIVSDFHARLLECVRWARPFDGTRLVLKMNGATIFDALIPFAVSAGHAHVPFVVELSEHGVRV